MQQRHHPPSASSQPLNERVLTDDGQQGMHGKQGIGSTTERHQGQVADAIYANCDQLNEIIEWVRLYKK